MALRRRSRRRRPIRRLLVLAGLASGITALRNRALAHHERRSPELAEPPGGRSNPG